MNILVTGAAGFIGSHFVEKLLDEGYSVTGIDNFDPFYPIGVKKSNIELALNNNNFRFIELDIRDNDKLKSELKENFNAIVHLAAKAGVRPSIIDPIGYQETNVYGTQNLLEFAKDKNIKQFVYASSSSVYGINPNVPWKETDYVLNPISPYASSKISGELLGHVYSHIHNIRFIALRLFTVYGPRQRPDLAIHKFVKLIIEGKTIPLYGNGHTRRDYTHVDDIVSGLYAALNYTGTMYEVINLGNHNTISLTEVVRIIEKSLAQKAEIEWLKEQPGDVPQTWADINKANKLLSWEPQTNFINGILEFVEWYSNLNVRMGK